MIHMDIIDTFGKIVGNKALHDPENARRLLLAGYRLQERRLLLFPDKQLPSSGQYVARVVMKNIIKALAKPEQGGNGQHFCSWRTSDSGRSDTVFGGSPVLFYGGNKM